MIFGGASRVLRMILAGPANSRQCLYRKSRASSCRPLCSLQRSTGGKNGGKRSCQRCRASGKCIPLAVHVAVCSTTSRSAGFDDVFMHNARLVPTSSPACRLVPKLLQKRESRSKGILRGGRSTFDAMGDGTDWLAALPARRDAQDKSRRRSPASPNSV